MPGRVIRENWLDSETINHLTARAPNGGPATLEDRKLGWLAELTFLRLCLAADDFGLLDGRMGPLHSKLWPLGEPTDPSELELLQVLDLLRRPHPVTGTKLVVPYETGGRPYLWIPNFRQRTRLTRPRFPLPPDHPEAAETFENSFNVGQSADKRRRDVGDSRSRSRVNTYTPTVLTGAKPGKPVHKSPAAIGKTTAPQPVDKPVHNAPTPRETPQRPALPELAPPQPDSGEPIGEPVPQRARPAKLPARWQTSREGIAEAGAYLDMPRLPGESDGAYVARLTARVNLEAA